MMAPSTGSGGNLTGDGVDSFGYDTENHLLSASALGNTIAYTYDPLGRRASKTVNSTITAYVDAGNQEIAEYDNSGTLLARYVYGADASAPVATVTVNGSSSTTAFDHKDGLGSIVALSDGATGDMTDSYAYDPYGESASLTGNAFRFAGMRLDAESGLYYDRARYYAPALGRFLQTDPIGINGGINLYAYVGNDPINGTDPAGTCYPLCTAVAGAAIGGVIGGVHAYLEGGDLSAILAGAGVGAIAGGVIGSGLPLAVGSAIVGAGASTTAVAAATYGTTVAVSGAGGLAVDLASQGANIISGNQTQLNTTQLIVSTGEGLATGALGSGLIKAGEATAELAGIELGTTTGVVGEAAAGQVEAAGTGIGFAVNHALK